MFSAKDFYPANKTPKILVVDDEPNFLFGISTILKKNGYIVIVASNSNAAILKAQSENPDAIILDVNMPKPNGLEVKKILNANPKTKLIPTIFLTALDDKKIRLCGLSMADDYITKPVDIDELILRLRAIFRRMDMGYKLGIQVSEQTKNVAPSPEFVLGKIDIKA
jgi:DNA-binding response OmpR family regulator